MTPTRSSRRSPPTSRWASSTSCSTAPATTRNASSSSSAPTSWLGSETVSEHELPRVTLCSRPADAGLNRMPAPRRVTFSRNVTLSLSRTCQCYCKYCAFATHQPHLHAPDEVEQLLDKAASRRVKELLVLTGEAPDHH